MHSRCPILRSGESTRTRDVQFSGQVKARALAMSNSQVRWALTCVEFELPSAAKCCFALCALCADKSTHYSLSGMNARRKDLQCFANSEFESRRIGLWANPRQPQNQQQNLGLIKSGIKPGTHGAQINIWVEKPTAGHPQR